MIHKSDQVQIVEVGLRDGLQNEKRIFSLEERLGLIHKLCGFGAKRLEIGAFVRPDKVPQMAGSAELIRMVLQEQLNGKIPRHCEFSALVPNEKGMNEAINSGLRSVAVFIACSESFSQKNINCSIEESFARVEKIMVLARKEKINVRGYLSVCFGCPYEGDVPTERVLQIADRLVQLGVSEVSIGDTIGIANQQQTRNLFEKLIAKISTNKLAGHFHNTRGQALININEAYHLGIRIFDSSVGGLGGCPYAPGASGNVSTEDVLYYFKGCGQSVDWGSPDLNSLRSLGIQLVTKSRLD